jgi:glycosyltransferase involved in cell wall biosynthesis
MKGPLVSVIVPTHNRAHLLPRAISSVLGQSYHHLECIVVDDGSTDETEQVVNQFTDDRLVYLRHETNRHASAARNTGMAYSNGELIAFLDDDDEWLAKKLEKQVSILLELPENVGMVYCWMDYFDQRGNLIREHHPRLRGYVFPYVLDAQRLGGCPTLLVRREVVVDVRGFDESLPRGNDGDFIRRVCRKYLVDLVPEVLVHVHVGHRGRISGSSAQDLHNVITGGETKLRKFGWELKKLPEAHTNVLLKLAVTYQALGNNRQALSCIWRAASIRACNIRVCRAGIYLVLRVMRNLVRKIGRGLYDSLTVSALEPIKRIRHKSSYLLGVKLPVLRRHLHENWAALSRVGRRSGANRPRVVYITGMPRTGTSLAKNYMGAHRGLEVMRFQRYGFVHAWQSSRRTENIVVDKATHYIQSVWKIYRAYGRSVAFYCLIRDPRDELASLLETDKHREVYRNQRFWKQWARTYERYLEFASFQGRPSLCYLIRYEDFVRWPIAAKIHFLKWLGVVPDTETITPDYGIIHEDDIQDWKLRERRKITTGSVGRWKRSPWQHQRALFEQWKRIDRVASLMERFGYGEEGCTGWSATMCGLTIFHDKAL